MKVSLIPQWPIDDEEDLESFFEGGEYDARVPGGVDRRFWVELKREFEADGHSFGLVNEFGVDDSDALVFVGFRHGIQYYRKAVSRDTRPYLFFIAREPPLLEIYHSTRHLVRLNPYFDRIFTWNDDVCELDGFEKYHWPIPNEHFQLEFPTETPDFSETPLLTMVNTNLSSTHVDELYSERERVVEFYERNHPDEFTLYGRNWNQRLTLRGVSNGNWVTTSYRVYEGEIEDKFQAFRNHRFALTFENLTGINGYFTEKSFDALLAGRLPVYWGAPNVDEYFPADAFVDYRNFGTPERLHEHLTTMSEEEYARRLAAAREFLAGRGRELFMAGNVARRLKKAIYDVHAGSEKPAIPPDLEVPEEMAETYDVPLDLPSDVIAETVRAVLRPPDELSRAAVLRLSTRIASEELLGFIRRRVIRPGSR